MQMGRRGLYLNDILEQKGKWPSLTMATFEVAGAGFEPATFGL
jgi:hypothetical protein